MPDLPQESGGSSGSAGRDGAGEPGQLSEVGTDGVEGGGGGAGQGPVDNNTIAQGQGDGHTSRSGGSAEICVRPHDIVGVAFHVTSAEDGSRAGWRAKVGTHGHTTSMANLHTFQGF